MSKRNKNHNNEFLQLNDKKSTNSAIDSKKSFNSKSNDYPSGYKAKNSMKYQPDLLLENEEDPNAINRNYWYRGELMQLVPDVFKELMNNTEVVVEQKIELLEILSGCETANRYNVYLLDKNKTKKFLFKCKEESSWCCRNCVPSDNRSFILRMIHIKNSNKKTDYKKTIADFERPFKCTCCCLWRPIMTAYYHDESKNKKRKRGQNKEEKEANKIRSQHLMGRVEELFTCSPELHVYGENGEIRWKIMGEYCQCGFCCRHFSLGKCYEVDFWIYDAQADPKTSKPVGNIHKVFKGLSELITDSDAFILTFPKKATPIERLMLVGSVIMIDYRYYEEMALCDCGNII